MGQFEDLILKFLRKEITQEEFIELQKLGLKFIKDFLKKEKNSTLERTLQKLYGSSYLEDLSQEFLLHLIKNRERLLSLNLLHKNYLITLTKNLLIKLLSKRESLKTKREFNFTEILERLSYDDPEEQILIIESQSPYVVDYLEDYYLEYAIITLREKLTPTELETLCLYLKKFWGEDIAIPIRDRDKIYKRWERLKPKLRKIFGEIDLVKENELKKFFQKIKSELCEQEDLN
jgi:DNA-directed RNA polymerase specialized sigma24 family protein